MNSTIRSLVLQHAVDADLQSTLDWVERHRGKDPKLAISGLGTCPRECFLNAYQHEAAHPLQYVPIPWEVEVLELFSLGRMYEAHLADVLLDTLGEDVVKREVSVGGGAWSGRIDFLVQSCEEFPQGAIIECKGTNPGYNFAHTQDRIPRLTHCLQVLAYQHFYEQEHGIRLPAYLYYRGWNKWAEFEIEEQGRIYWSGLNGGHEREGEFDERLESHMAMIDIYWGEMDNIMGVSGHDDPFENRWACLRNNRGGWFPKCRWLGVCHPQLKGDGPFEEEF